MEKFEMKKFEMKQIDLSSIVGGDQILTKIRDGVFGGSVSITITYDDCGNKIDRVRNTDLG
jgi:hypothetical protein